MHRAKCVSAVGLWATTGGSALTRSAGLVVLLGALATWACGEAREATRVELEVLVDGSAVEDVTTDLGYRVHVTALRAALGELEFAVAGEVHASTPGALSRLFVPRARAHPGHYTGGEVTGMLPGRFVADWVGDQGGALGLAILLEGTYDSANFTLHRADLDLGLAVDDPLLGHTAILEGVAEKEGASIPFTARIDSPPSRQVVGIPFEARVRGGADFALGLAFGTRDPLEKDTLFDGIEFSLLARDAQGRAWLEETSEAQANLDSYYTLRRRFQTHDHFWIQPLIQGVSSP